MMQSRSLVRSTLNPIFFGAAIWLDPRFGCFSDAGVTPCVDGSSVFRWQDRITGMQFDQTIIANRPTWRANGGYPFVQFDGVDDLLQTGTGIPGKPWSYIGGLLLTVVSNDRVIMAGASASGAQKLKAVNSGTPGRRQAGIDGVVNWNVGNSTLIANRNYTIALSYGMSGPANYHLSSRFDGLALADTTSSSFAINTRRLGASGSATELYGGRMYDQVFFTRNVPSSTLSALHLFIADRMQ